MTQSLHWRSEAGLPAPAEVQAVDASIAIEDAYAQLAAGMYLLWQGDWVRGRHMLQALTQRADQRLGRQRGPRPATPLAAFEQHRQRQGARAALLARFLVIVDKNYRVPLRRAQSVAVACEQAWGAPDGQDSLLALRELLAVISAAEWRKKGVPVPAVQGRIYPHYGVFSPVRGEYVDLVATAPLPPVCELAFDIGTGSGILAAVLARRGVKRVIGTDQDARALQCATENAEKLGLTAQISVHKADLFPAGKAPLIVCNPPWIPAQPSAPVEYAVYDPASRMLRGFLEGLATHLTEGGEGWLIISDIAEHLGLRSRQQLLDWIACAGLQVVGRLETRPTHPKTRDASDPLHVARAQEVTSLWRLAAASENFSTGWDPATTS